MYKLLLKYNYHFNIQNHSFQLLYLYILFYIPFIYKSEPIQKRLSQIKIQLNLYYSFPLPKATFHFWLSQTITSPQVTFHFWRNQTFHLTAGDSSPLRSKPFPSPQVTLHLCEANLSPHHRWPFTFDKVKPSLHHRWPFTFDEVKPSPHHRWPFTFDKVKPSPHRRWPFIST